jgi:hypothetical protein
VVRGTACLKTSKFHNSGRVSFVGISHVFKPQQVLIGSRSQEMPNDDDEMLL